VKAHLLNPARDFDWQWTFHAAAEREAKRRGWKYEAPEDFDWRAGLPWNAETLAQDLSLDTLFEAMAGDDDVIFEVARKVILAGVEADIETIRYRQSILRDCLANAETVRKLYAIAEEAIEKHKAHAAGTLSRFPDWVLRKAIEQLGISVGDLRKMRQLAESHGARFAAPGWTEFFAMLQRDLDDDYLGVVEGHLDQLRLRNGELVSAELGPGNAGRRYMLHPVITEEGWKLQSWIRDFFEEKQQTYSFEIPARDVAGAQALAELGNRGIVLAANALGQAADHVLDFFGVLRAELAFYVGCLNLFDRLKGKGEPICMPVPTPTEEQALSFRGLYDVGLTLSIERRTVGNDADADRKSLVVITGPNTGGKSTLLRGIGVAQLMMQSGMFVGAEAFTASLCNGLFTHYRGEEDENLRSGKFDEELRRMSDIVDRVRPGATVLFNESFAATNEREGSEIARQIVTALVENRVRTFFVTHMFELASGFLHHPPGDVLSLRAEREATGSRTFKLHEGEPLPTSFGEDLYDKIFGRRAEVVNR